MTEAGISADPAQSSRSTSFGAGGLAIILRRLAEIRMAAAAFFLPSRPESTEVQDESGPVKTEDAAATVSPAADATATAFFRLSHPESSEVQDESGPVETENAAADVSLAADAHSDSPQIQAIGDFVPDQQEIDRRRNLVRIYFNDFWSEVPHKPAAFVQRLDAAEDYLNERLAANGESWRLDAKMRVMLSLPPRSNSSVDRPPTG